MPRPVKPHASTETDATDQVLRASRALVGVASRSLARLESDITLPQYRALVLLSQHGERSASQLAEALDIAPSTLTGLCDRLERKGLITRATSVESRRVVVVRLSARGRTLIQSVTTRRRREINAILDRLEPNERRRVVAAFDAFAAAAGEAPEHAWKLGWT